MVSGWSLKLAHFGHMATTTALLVVKCNCNSCHPEASQWLKQSPVLGWMEGEVLAYMTSTALERHRGTGNDEESCNTCTWLRGTTLESNRLEWWVHCLLWTSLTFLSFRIPNRKIEVIMHLPNRTIIKVEWNKAWHRVREWYMVDTIAINRP